jgi:hypothetical protein
MAEDHSKNKLLDVLDIEEREQLRSLMEEITVRPEEVLWGWKRKLLQYSYAVVTQIAWSAACHALHSVAARCARWLLSLKDYAKA